QQLVSDRVAERIIDLLEMVEIKAEYRKTVATPHLYESLLDTLGKQDAIGQIGESIVARHEHDACLCMAALGHVLICGHPAAVHRGLVGHRDDATMAELLELRALGALADESFLLRDELRRCLADVISGHDAQLENLAERHPRPYPRRRQSEDFKEAPIDHFQPVVGIVQAETLRHVV